MSQTQHSNDTTSQYLHILGANAAITADSADTDGEFTVMDMLAPPGFENGLHTHPQSEVFHVIEGEMALYVDGSYTHLAAGETGHVAGGEQHGFRVEGETSLHVIVTLTPGGAEAFFRAVGQPADDRSLPEPREVTEADLEALFATGAEHGFEFFGPLPATD